MDCVLGNREMNYGILDEQKAEMSFLNTHLGFFFLFVCYFIHSEYCQKPEELC